MSFVKSLIVVSLFFSTNAFSAESNVLDSARLCMKVLSQNDFDINFIPNRYDDENVILEQVHLAPIHVSEINRYFKIKEDYSKVLGPYLDCVSRSEFKKQDDGINKAWSAVLEKSDFSKGRHLVKIKNHEIPRLSGALKRLAELGCKGKEKCSTLATSVYLNDEEEKMLKEYGIECANNPFTSSCNSKVDTLAKKVFPNFLFSSYVSMELASYKSEKNSVLEKKICGKEAIAEKKALAELEKQYNIVGKVIKALGFNEELMIGMSEESALQALINGKAHVVKYSYRPKNKNKKYFEGLADKDNFVEGTKARILKRYSESPEKSYLYYPKSPNNDSNKGVVNTYFSDYYMRGLYDECSPSAIAKIQKAQKSKIDSSVGSK